MAMNKNVNWGLITTVVLLVAFILAGIFVDPIENGLQIGGGGRMFYFDSGY